MRPSNFLDWSIGYNKDWPIRWETETLGTIAPTRTLRRWVIVEDGREIAALVGKRQKQVVVRFQQPSHRQFFRSELAIAPRPMACWIELDDQSAQTGEGRIGLLRTALPLRLDAVPEIVVPEPILNTVEGMTLERLRDGSGFECGEDTLMVVSSPVVLATAEVGSRQPIDVYHSEGWKLECTVQGDPGKQYLSVDKILKHHPKVAKSARLAAVPAAPQFVIDHQRGAGQDLGALLPRVQHLIRAWISYEEIGRAFENELLDDRRAHPLEYDTAVPVEVGDELDWELSAPHGLELLKYWTKNRGKRDEIDIGAPVEIHDLENKTDPVLSNLDKLLVTSSSLKARVSLTENGKVPPRRGKLLAIEDRGDVTQRRRRDKALQRLRSGECACPDLLGYLLDPSTVPINTRADSAGSKGSRYQLNDEQARALRTARGLPPLVLIQGPPGTGKTRVIVEIVRELRRIHRRGMNDEHGIRRPLKILITSIQRQAVLNVLEKLQDDFVFVKAVGLDVDRDPMEIYIQQASQIAETLERGNRHKLNYVKYQDLTTISGMLERARAELVSPLPVDVPGLLKSIKEAPEVRSLTTSLKASLNTILEAIDTSPIAAEQIPLECTNRLRDVIARLAEAPEELSRDVIKDSLSHFAQLEEILNQLKSGTQIVDPALYKLGHRWKRYSKRHGDSIVEGEPEPRAFQEWITLLHDSKQACETWVHTSNSTQNSMPEHLKEAVGWIYRASDAVSDGIVDYRETEEAIIFDWIHSLRHSSAELREVFYKHAATTASTCQKADRRDTDEIYDVVIVDEAARAGLDILVPITLARSIILLGDHKQLPPHVESEYLWRLPDDVRDRFDLQTESLFSWLMKNLPAQNRIQLREQYRMHEDIGRMVSKVFYEPELKLEHYFSQSRAAERAPNFGLLGNRPLVWVDTSDFLQNPQERKRVRWPCEEENEYEADCVMRVLAAADRTILENYFEESHGLPVVGIITFYKRQETLLRDKLSQRNDPRFERLIRIGTVDSFQGYEFPLVLLSCVKSNKSGRIGFLKPLQRINVAMSRAQRQLIIFGDSSTLAQNRENLGSRQLEEAFGEVKRQGGVTGSMEALAGARA